MSPRSLQRLCSLLAIALLPLVRGTSARERHSHVARQNVYDTNVVQIDGNAKNHDQEFFRFVTRPDIDAPRWDVKIYDKDALSEGYWFQATYVMALQKQGDNRPWLGPHIYDGNGELIWSGAPMFHGYNVKDFHVANVGGEMMMTGIFQHEREGVTIDNTYTLRDRLPIGKGTDQAMNLHGFHTAYNGTVALQMLQHSRRATREELNGIGYKKRYCRVNYPGFEELDVATWNVTFAWNSQGHIGLNESFTERNCGHHKNWDYLHANSIDKFPDGDYLYSGRHTDTVYKISHKDGSIVWRFARRKDWSDFKFDDHFSGQHMARVRSQNDTHTVISFLDNAIRPGDPHTTNDFSRGMWVALRTDTQPMTAEVIGTYDHPHADYAPGRGNAQLLDNGNRFIAWWNHSLQSEHAADGRLLMEARWKAEGLKSYRSYKFPWVGQPKNPPDVHSEAFAVGRGEAKGHLRTAVHVSWNGATEVAKWHLYKTTVDGQTREKVASVPRQGFESMLLYHGYATYVVVEAVDKEGEPLGESQVFKTILPGGTITPEVLEEQDWLQRYANGGNMSLATSTTQKVTAALSNPVVVYVSGLLTCAAVVFVFYFWRRWRKESNGPAWWQKNRLRNDHKYKELSASVEDIEEDEGMRDVVEMREEERRSGEGERRDEEDRSDEKMIEDV